MASSAVADDHRVMDDRREVVVRRVDDRRSVARRHTERRALTERRDSAWKVL